MNEMVPASKSGYPPPIFVFLLQIVGFRRDENKGKAIRRGVFCIRTEVARFVQIADKFSLFVLHVWKKKAGLFPALRWTPGFPLRPLRLYIGGSHIQEPPPQKSIVLTHLSRMVALPFPPPYLNGSFALFTNKGTLRLGDHRSPLWRGRRKR